jgi:signal transduction histidine kinase
MGMKRTLDVLNAMEADGIIGRYALAGAVAAYNYIEPAVTEDVLVALERGSAPGTLGLISLAPIFSYLKAKGYQEFRREGIVIEGWPVQFLPVADALDVEALAQAEEIDLPFTTSNSVVRTRVLRPEHLAAIALRVGRPKDLSRIAQFLAEKAVEFSALCGVIERHRLSNAWQLFCQQFRATILVLENNVDD